MAKKYKTAYTDSACLDKNVFEKKNRQKLEIFQLYYFLDNSGGQNCGQ